MYFSENKHFTKKLILSEHDEFYEKLVFNEMEPKKRWKTQSELVFSAWGGKNAFYVKCCFFIEIM